MPLLYEALTPKIETLQITTRTFIGGYYYTDDTVELLKPENTLTVGTRFYFYVISQYFTFEGWLPWANQKVQLVKDGKVLEEGYTDNGGTCCFPTTYGETYKVEEGTHQFKAVTVATPESLASESDILKITGTTVSPPPTPPWQEQLKKYAPWLIAGGVTLAAIIYLATRK
jgi:hypothetical protein